ncbi:MAG: coenzyme F420-0:L-glutamate ligase [Acidimicrobiia bacterium]
MQTYTSASLEIIPVNGIGEIRPGDRLGTLIASTSSANGCDLRNGDILVVTQKAVSKAEGRIVRVENEADRHRVIMEQSRRVLRKRGDMIISETHHGFVCANAGVDNSNVEHGYVSVLPKNPDASAHRIREEVFDSCGARVAVVISDTFGRPWRRGQTNVAIGVAGMKPMLDYRGSLDTFGRRLEATEIAIADELACAAELVMGKSAGIPAAIVRGLAGECIAGNGAAKELLRPYTEDLFR